MCLQRFVCVCVCVCVSLCVMAGVSSWLFPVGRIMTSRRSEVEEQR